MMRTDNAMAVALWLIVASLIALLAAWNKRRTRVGTAAMLIITGSVAVTLASISTIVYAHDPVKALLQGIATAYGIAAVLVWRFFVLEK